MNTMPRATCNHGVSIYKVCIDCLRGTRQGVDPGMEVPSCNHTAGESPGCDVCMPVVKVDLGAVKETNPKDAIADKKLPLWLLSTTAKIQWALAQFAGMVKYGAWNWRPAGVRASVYISAMERHLEAFKNGERLDPTDKTHHLGNIMACCAILIDAEEAGNMTDDRPFMLNHRRALEEAEATMAYIREKYADKLPRHWTIADSK